MTGWIWRGYDLAYRWLHGLEELPTEKGAVLRIGVERYRGRPLVLKDGTSVQPGDLIATIHFHNEAVAALHDRNPNPVRAGILIVNAYERSLKALAGLLDDHPRYQPVKALTGTTILHQGVERFGFDIHPPLPGLMGRLVSAYGRSMLARYHPLGRERGKQKRFEARAIWISARELRRRYGRERSSLNETSR
jgi:hypothetical protein